MKAIDFKIEKKMPGALARAGQITTPHGVIKTPAFVTVGTKATVKAMTPEQLKEAGSQVVLANTYHLYLQPGDKIIREAGGLNEFMNWSGPTMTDSGGFQVFSLGVAYGKDPERKSTSNGARISKVMSTDELLFIPERSSADDGVPKLATIGNDGVSFRSHIDGSLHYITPEKSIEIQHNLGADIIFAFDECTSPTEDFKYQEEALSRTHAWAKRSLERHLQLEKEKAFPPLLNKEGNEGRSLINSPLPNPPLSKGRGNAILPQALFGIVQGGRSKELRQKSAEVIGGIGGFDGFGIGGSFAKEDMSSAVKWVNEILPEEKPRHLLGIGEPEDLFIGVENGVDLFDCVAPTRLARNGTLYTKNGKINLMNAKFVNDFNPIEDCECYTCSGGKGLSSGSEADGGETLRSQKGYTKAYLSHLFRAKEMEAGTLASIHNVYFITNLVAQMREAILNNNFLKFKEEFLKGYKK